MNTKTAVNTSSSNSNLFVFLNTAIVKLESKGKQRSCSALVDKAAQRTVMVVSCGVMRTPHFGGANESLVRSTRRSLYAMLDHKKGKLRYPTKDRMRIRHYEIARVLNQRLLTYPSANPDDYRPIMAVNISTDTGTGWTGTWQVLRCRPTCTISLCAEDRRRIFPRIYGGPRICHL